MFDIIKNNLLLWIVIFLAVVAPSVLFGAVKVVVYIICGIIILLFILSLVFRARIQTMRSRMEQEMHSASGGRRATQDEGDVKIFTTSSTSEKRVRKDVGDYVDFEEIEK